MKTHALLSSTKKQKFDNHQESLNDDDLQHKVAKLFDEGKTESSFMLFQKVMLSLNLCYVKKNINVFLSIIGIAADDVEKKC
jgi:hypothetical protein